MEKNPVYLDFDNLYTKREEKTHNSWQFTGNTLVCVSHVSFIFL